MRMSASGEQSMIAVAIDQILRLAPSISGPIEPVVSSTKATSTTGFAMRLMSASAGSANAVVTANTAENDAGASARPMRENLSLKDMGDPSGSLPDGGNHSWPS